MAESEPNNSRSEKSSLTGLAKRLGRLPADKRRAALEMSAALAGVSLKASREFVEAVPKAAEILSADDLRNWAELGRRLAMGNAEIGAAFFAEGVEGLKLVPEAARSRVFQICTRQLILSSSISLETLKFVPELAAEVKDDDFLSESLDLAAEIASRSAKHSGDLLRATPKLAAAIEKFGEEKGKVLRAVVELASLFANRTGGMTADLWAILPPALGGLSAEEAVALLKRAAEFLEFGGSVTLHFVSSGAEVLQKAAPTFDVWSDVLKKVAPHGNAVLISFLRATPRFFKRIPTGGFDLAPVLRVLELTGEIAESDAESALAAFRSSAGALRSSSLEQFENWVETGLREKRDESSKARRSYFALETRESNDELQRSRSGVSLEEIQTVLRIYIEALTGKEIEVAPLSAIPQESRIGDGQTIYLPATIDEFENDAMDFRLYKVLAAHGAGQIEFGTFETNTNGLKAAYAELSDLYSATADQTDAFSLAGYIEDVQKGESANGMLPFAEPKALPEDSDYRAVLKVFPEPRLARKIFGTMENARIDNRLRTAYRGLRKDLDLMRDFLRNNRPYIFDVPMHQVPFELLFQITLCGGATDDSRQFYGQVVSEIETTVDSYLKMKTAGVADSLMATSRVYTLFQNISFEQKQEAETDESEEEKEFASSVSRL